MLFLNELQTQKSAFRNLNGNEFKRAQNNTDTVLLDVRTAGEFASGTIPGSKNIDMMSPDFFEKIAGLDKSKEYLVFCRSGSRSAHACSLMARHGFQTANLDGGIGEYPV